MGQKIHPTGFRLSVLKNWSSKWYANSKNFPVMLNEDIKVREYLKRSWHMLRLVESSSRGPLRTLGSPSIAPVQES